MVIVEYNYLCIHYHVHLIILASLYIIYFIMYITAHIDVLLYDFEWAINLSINNQSNQSIDQVRIPETCK